MTDLPPAAPVGASPQALPPLPVEKPKQPMYLRLLYGVIGFVVIVIGVVRIYDVFVLPGCDSDRVTDTLKQLIVDNAKVVVNSIDDIKPTSEASSPRTCSASVHTPGEKDLVEYEVSWSGWSAQVKITKATPTGETAPPATPTAPTPAT